MLKDLRRFDNLGSPEYFYELFRNLNSSEVVWRKDDIDTYFRNRVIRGRSIFDGCILLAQTISIINIGDDGTIALNGIIEDFLFSEKQMCDKFVEALFLAIKDDSIFQDIFSSKNISYDIIYHSIQINNSAFGFKNASLKQLLIDFDVIRIHPTTEIKKFILNSRYKKLFDKTILPEIRKKKLGIDELKQLLEQQSIYGEEAERFVLNYEAIRLENKEGIDWVAEYSVAEGYDIASFETKESASIDRFIEVKSYQGNPYFFWTRNEIDISRIKGKSYFLYLVDRLRLNSPDYVPLIIQDPFNNILSDSNWDKQVEKYKITFVGNDSAIV